MSLLGTRARDLDRMRRFFALLRRVSGHYRAVMDRSGLSPEDSPVEVLGRFPPTSREDYRDILQPEALARLSGERQASTELAEAADKLIDSPGALQLRTLQTLAEVAAERNSTLIFPIPIELMTLFRPPEKASHPDVP